MPTATRQKPPKAPKRTDSLVEQLLETYTAEEQPEPPGKEAHVDEALRELLEREFSKLLASTGQDASETPGTPQPQTAAAVVEAPPAEQPKTVKRINLIQLQARNMVSRTIPAISPETLAAFDKGIGNQWIYIIGVYGLTKENRCRIGLVLEIDWKEHKARITVEGEDVTIDKTVFAEDIAPEIANGAAVFRGAVLLEQLTSTWRCSYPKELDRDAINKELGFFPAEALVWLGKPESTTSRLSELPEASITLLEA